MKNFIAAKTKLYEVISDLENENLIDEKESSSIKQMVLDNHHTSLEVLQKYDENPTEETLKSEILNTLKPAVQPTFEGAGGDAENFNVAVGSEETSPLGKKLLEKKKSRQGAVGILGLASLLKAVQ